MENTDNISDGYAKIYISISIGQLCWAGHNDHL